MHRLKQTSPPLTSIKMNKLLSNTTTLGEKKQRYYFTQQNPLFVWAVIY